MKDQIRNKILELLDIRDPDNLSDIELFKLLDKKRKSLHPDRTTDNDVKEEYEAKVKELNALYKQFGDLIKDSSSSELSLEIYKGEVAYDYVNSKLENDELKDKVQILGYEIDSLKRNLIEKEEVIKRLNETKVHEETEKLKELFKPKKGNLILLSISAFLSGLILVLSSTEQAVKFYSSNLPMLNPNVISIITLSVLIVVTIIFAINYVKKLIINRWTEIIRSTEFNTKLFYYVEDNVEPKSDSPSYYYLKKTYKFKERIIYDFVDSFFNPKSKIIGLLRTIIGLNKYSVFENLKRIIIYELINKDVIKVDGNSGFDKILKYEE